jgi:primosomal protein N' (replication factor Y)
LLAQVSGRAGRKNKRGKVVIQTYDPFHSVIRYVIDNNYIEMYNSQIIERKSFKYPPFYRLISLTVKHRDENTLNSAASEMARELRKVFPDKVLGPEFPFISRIKNMYLKNIIIKLEKNLNVKETKAALIQLTDKLINDEKYKGLRVAVDVDPL